MAAMTTVRPSPGVLAVVAVLPRHRPLDVFSRLLPEPEFVQWDVPNRALCAALRAPECPQVAQLPQVAPVLDRESRQHLVVDDSLVPALTARQEPSGFQSLHVRIRTRLPTRLEGTHRIS